MNLHLFHMFLKYLPQLEKEYSFWMDGVDHLGEERSEFKRVVLVEPGVILNRPGNGPIGVHPLLSGTELRSGTRYLIAVKFCVSVTTLIWWTKLQGPDTAE